MLVSKIRNFLTLPHIAIIVISVVLLQTLPFKFLGFSESVALFTKLGQEPRGRIGSGIFELLGVIGLWAPFYGSSWSRSRKYAALGIALLMIGALYFHATILGWDGLALFAGIVLICSVFIVIKE